MPQHGRVQVQGVGSAPKLQAVVNAGGQYRVQTQQAGRNKMMDLADSLSLINPTLKDYSIASALDKQFKMKEGAEAWMQDPEAVNNQLKQFASAQDVTKKKIRKLVESGALPAEANPIRLLGAMRARSEVMVNRDYRAGLMNADTLMTTTDPEVEILKQREVFLEQGDFDSTIVRNEALKHMDRVEDEFRNNVNSRLQAYEIEEGKENWLQIGKERIGHAVNGTIDLNDPHITEWLNHEAGMFQGSRSFAFEKLIKKDLLEGLTTTVKNPDGSETTKYTPGQVKDFLGKLREWKIGGGAMFADAQTGASINSFALYVDSLSAVIEKKNASAIDRATDVIISDATERFLDEFSTTGGVSEGSFNTIADEVLEQVPVHLRDKALTTLIARFKGLNGMVEETDANKTAFSNFNLAIEKGIDLDDVKENIKKARDSNGLTSGQWDTLNGRLEKMRDFSKRIIEADSFKRVEDTYEELITGFGKFAPFPGSPSKTGFFKAEDAGPDGRGGTLFDMIKEDHPLGETGATVFVYRQHEIYQTMLKQELRERWDVYFKAQQQLRSWGIPPASNLENVDGIVESLLGALPTVSEEVFNKWQTVTIAEANRRFGLKFELKQTQP
jgi:hypothetical protein